MRGATTLCRFNIGTRRVNASLRGEASPFARQKVLHGNDWLDPDQGVDEM
jgi:hypothetical protein